MFKRITYFTYGVLCYAVFFATFLYAIGWVGNLFVPTSIDAARSAGQPLLQALAINMLLLSGFAVQHSVMARPAFKRAWTRVVPKPLERSTYVLFSSVALIALFYWWQPLGGIIWNVEDPILSGLLLSGFMFGWLLVLVSTFLINHFDLFGLRQTWLFLCDKPYRPLEFKTPWLYRHIRHPLYVGWFFAFWCTPIMTAAHLLFAVMTTVYILIAIRLEERDLMKAHPEYEGYRRKVSMLVPRIKPRNGQQPGYATDNT